VPSAKTNHSTSRPYNPGGHARRFGLFRFRSPLLTESLLVFFSSSYLDVSVQRVSDFRLRVFNAPGCPIRTRTDLSSFATPRAFSQLTASFVASGSQGIPHAPLFHFLASACKNAHQYLIPSQTRESGQSPKTRTKPGFPRPPHQFTALPSLSMNS
jgi:hypothetical protein